MDLGRTLGDKFNYIHMRLVALCFDKPERVFENCFKNLEPGGWIEIQDPDLVIQSTDGSHEGEYSTIQESCFR